MEVRVNDVSFSYNGCRALKHISFEVGNGDMLAIIGQNGSGKSTLLKCISRILKTDEGCIQINEIPLPLIPASRLSRTMAYIPQSEETTCGISVFDTVLLGRKPYIGSRPLARDMELVADLLTRLELEQVAMRPLNTLSGGQRQRVLIARALYKDPDYLFLDEATNALDTINEQKIVRALNNVFKNRTVIVVAHRLSTIRRADQIIVLKAGMIIETGNHQSLMTNKQYYYNLIQSQYEPETNTFSTEESAD